MGPRPWLRAFHPPITHGVAGPSRAKRFRPRLFGELESSDRNPRMAFVVPPLPAHLELLDLLVAALAVGGFLPAVLCLHRLALRFVPGRDAALRRVKRA